MQKTVKYKNGTKLKSWVHVNRPFRNRALIIYQILSTQSFKKMYGDQFGEFVCGYWGVKVLVTTLRQVYSWLRRLKRWIALSIG